MSNVIGFDYGTRRIGIAVGVVDLQTANPLTTLLVPSSGIPWDEISAIINEWKPSQLVVGTVSHSTQNQNVIQTLVATFCKSLNSRYHLPVETVDEANTSVKAYEVLKDLRSKGQRKKIQKTDIDKAAAAIILDSWFATRNNSEVEKN